MIQYIFDCENLGNKTIIKSFDDSIYIINSLGNLLKYNFYEYNLTLKEVDKIEKLKDDEVIENISFNDVGLLSLEEKLYLFNSSLFSIDN